MLTFCTVFVYTLFHIMCRCKYFKNNCEITVSWHSYHCSFILCLYSSVGAIAVLDCICTVTLVPLQFRTMFVLHWYCVCTELVLLQFCTVFVQRRWFHFGFVLCRSCHHQIFCELRS